jgi:hypothetical protein
VSEAAIQTDISTSIGKIRWLEIRDGRLRLVLDDQSVWHISAVDGNGVWAARNRWGLWRIPREAIGDEEWKKIQALWERLGADRHRHGSASPPTASGVGRGGAGSKRNGGGRAGSTPASSRRKASGGGGGLRRVRRRA